MPPPAIHYAEVPRMVIATIIRLREAALRIDRAAKFTAPDDERAVEQAALFEIGQKSADGLVGIAALGRMSLGIAVLVPAAMQHLHHACATFH